MTHKETIQQSIDKIKDLYNQGTPLQKIAKIIEVNSAVLYDYIHKNHTFGTKQKIR